MFLMASLGTQWQRTRTPIQDTQVQPLGREDPLEEEMATHSVAFLPGESHGQRNLVGYRPRGYKTVSHDLTTKQQ